MSVHIERCVYGACAKTAESEEKQYGACAESWKALGRGECRQRARNTPIELSGQRPTRPATYAGRQCRRSSTCGRMLAPLPRGHPTEKHSGSPHA